MLARSAFKMAVVMVEGGLSGEKWGVAVPLNVSDDMPHRHGGHLSPSCSVTTSEVLLQCVADLSLIVCLLLSPCRIFIKECAASRQCRCS